MMTRLIEADSLLFTHPDSAYSVLQNMRQEIEPLSEPVRTYYDLLTIAADDKTFRKHTSDSLIQHIIDYYEKSGSQSHLAMAYYYAGRVYTDLDINKNKALYYNELAMLCDTVWLNDYWRSRILAQKGYFYLRNGLLEEATDMQELSRSYCLQIGDTTGARYCSEDLATIQQMKDTIVRDTATMLATRQACKLVVERAHNKALRLQSEQKKESSSHINVTTTVLIIVAVLYLLLLWWKKKSRHENVKENEQTDIPTNEASAVQNVVPTPIQRAFYDAEIDELLQTRIKADKTLKPADWRLIEERLLTTFPDFRNRLYSLYELSETEYHICLLIKMEIAPKNMARLLAMGSSSVSQSRLRMQQKVFGGNGTAKDWDMFIQSL